MTAAPLSAPIRIAILGAGIIAQSIHIPTIRRAGFELTNVCDLSPSRVAELVHRLGIRGTTLPEDVFNDPSVDAVLIATPGSHAELTKAALESNKHVLAEKPLALTLSETEQIENLAARVGKVVQVGYMKMYDPLTHRVRAELSALNDVRLVRVTVAHPDDSPQIQHLRITPPVRDADLERIQQANDYEERVSLIALGDAPDGLLRYYRDVLNGSVVHELSMLRAVGLPVPNEWVAEAFPTLDGPDPASLLATAKVGDARFILSWNWLPDYPEYDEELKVLAANGRLEYHLARPYLLEERSRLRVERNAGTERTDTTYVDAFETGFLRQLDAFALAIREGGPVIANLAGVKEDLVSLQALAKAIASTNGTTIVTESDQISETSA